MILSRYTLKNINSSSVIIPEDSLFELPEKVLQFGTGVLLRALPDYFIDKANRQGIFNGRIVVVKSTTHGNTSAFDKQDGLYTLCIRGINNGKIAEENIVNSSISRVLNAHDEWEQILECAHNQHMQIIISNTTEVGIQFVNDDIRRHPPTSFPGKLLAFLYERFQAFGGSAHSGMVIVPTELIVDNGKKLESIVLELAHLNSLEDEFIGWLENHNCFCNSLVDRIVPGKPDAEKSLSLEKELGYTDDLLTMSEAYSLWAIEGDEEIKKILSFAEADEGVKIEPHIDIYRELKLRLLNGTHTLSCGPAFLAGYITVQEAMENETMSKFISDLMHNEIAPSIPYEVRLDTSKDFGNKVLDRFRNQYIKHLWINITVQYSLKMKMRCIPVLLKHYQNNDTVPEAFALGFAAYLFFMKPVMQKDEKYYGELDDKHYFIHDEMAETFYKRWNILTPLELVQQVLRDNEFWGEDLHALPGFANAVTNKLDLIMQGKIQEALSTIVAKKPVLV